MYIEFPKGSFDKSGYSVDKVKTSFYDDLNAKMSVFVDENTNNDNYFQNFDNIIDQIIAFLVTSKAVSNDLDNAVSKFIDTVNFRTYIPSMTGRMIVDGSVKQFTISYYTLVCLSALKKANFEPIENLEKERKTTNRELNRAFRAMHCKAFQFIQKNYDCNKSYTVREIFNTFGFAIPDTEGVKEAEKVLDSTFTLYNVNVLDGVTTRIQRFTNILAELTSNTESYSGFNNFTKMPNSMVPNFTRQATDYGSVTLYNNNMAFMQTYQFVYSCWEHLVSIRYVLQKCVKNGDVDKKVNCGIRKETKINVVFDLFFNRINASVQKFHNKCIPNIRKLKKELNSKTHKQFLCETVFTTPVLSVMALNEILNVNRRLMESVEDPLTSSVLSYHCKSIESLLLSIGYCDQIMTHFVTVWGGINRCITLLNTKSRPTLTMSKIMQAYLGKDVLDNKANTYITTKFLDRTNDKYLNMQKPIIDEFELLINHTLKNIEIDLTDWEILGIRMVARSMNFLVNQPSPITKGGEIGENSYYKNCIALDEIETYDIFTSLKPRYRFNTHKESSLFNKDVLTFIARAVMELKDTKLKSVTRIPSSTLSAKVYFDAVCSIALDDTQISPDILALEKELENDQFFKTMQEFGSLYNTYNLPMNTTSRNKFPGSVFNFNKICSNMYTSFVKIIHSNR